MKVYLVLEDSMLYQIPETWDASNGHELLRIATKEEIIVTGARANKLSDTEYDIDISDTVDSFSIATDTEVKTVTVFRDYEDTSKFEFWLEQHQLEYLIEPCKAIGWHKIKEAALYCRSISLMQGTEYAINQVLKLLELTDNVELERIWLSKDAVVLPSDQGNLVLASGTKAYDELHKAGYARLGYRLSNFLKLHYTLDDFNPWTLEIEHASEVLTFTLQQVIDIISKSLPATLRITDIELIRIGLAIIGMYVATMQSKMQYTSITLEPIIDIQRVLQYEYLQFVYDINTKEYIRIASPEEPYKPTYAVMFSVYCPRTFYNISFSDESGEQFLYIREIVGTKHFVIQPKPTTSKIHCRYRTDTGALIELDFDVIVLKASNYLPVLQFNQAIQIGQENAYPSENQVFVGGMVEILSQYRDEARKCDGKHRTFLKSKIPAGYCIYYVPEHVKEIYVNDGTSTTKYSTEHDIPGYSRDYTTLTVIDTENFYKSTVEKFLVLWSLAYEGTYDKSIYWTEQIVNNEIDEDCIQIDSNIQIVYAKQEMRYLSEWINPFFTANIIDKLMLSKSWKLETEYGRSSVNYGTAMPPSIEHEQIWQDIEHTNSMMHCNFGVTQAFESNPETENLHLDSVMFYCRRLNLYAGSELFQNAMRRPSLQFSIAKNVRPHLPYCLIREDCSFELFYRKTVNDDFMLIKETDKVMVFALVKTGYYQIHIFNDYYDKTLDFKI